MSITFPLPSPLRGEDEQVRTSPGRSQPCPGDRAGLLMVGVESMERGAFPEIPPLPYPSPSRGGAYLHSPETSR